MGVVQARDQAAFEAARAKAEGRQAPVSTPVAQPEPSPAPTSAQGKPAPAAGSSGGQSQASHSGALETVKRYKAKRARKEATAQAEIAAGRTGYGPARRQGEEGYVPHKFSQEVSEVVNEALGAVDYEHQRQQNFWAANNLFQSMREAGIESAPYFVVPTKKGGTRNRSIHSSVGTPSDALDAALREHGTDLGIKDRAGLLQRIAADSGITVDEAQLEQVILDRIGEAGKIAQQLYKNNSEYGGRTLSNMHRFLREDAESANLIAQAQGFRDLQEMAEVINRQAGAPAARRDLSGTGQAKGKGDTASAVPTDTAEGGRQGEEQNWFNKAKGWLGAEGMGGVPNWAYTAGGTVGTGLALAALLSDRGLPQEDPAAYAQQQALVNSYGSY